MTSTTSLDELLASYPPDVRALTLEGRRLIRKLLPNVEEHVDASARVVAYGYGRGYRDMVCTLILSKSGVKLGLVGGATLDDPRGLLQGSGKVHRYVQLHRPADLRQAGVRPLIKAAYARWHRRTGALRPKAR